MIVTDQFVHVHLHKAGGSFVNAFVRQFYPSAHFVGYHYPLGLLPTQWRHLPVLGSVRNPWDWYVSYYSFQQQLLTAARQHLASMSPSELARYESAGNDPLNGVDVLFEQLSHGGADDFADTTRSILGLGEDERLLDSVLEELPDRLDRRGRSTPIQATGFRGMNLRAEDLRPIRSTGVGLCSFLVAHLYSGGPAIHLLRFENLRDDLLRSLETVGVQITRQMRDWVLHAQPVNASRHRPYPHYYDAGLAELVRVRDQSVIDRFDYEFATPGVVST
jgi:hypothetical protein